MMVSQMFAALAVVLWWKRGLGGEGQHGEPLLAKAHRGAPRPPRVVIAKGWLVLVGSS